MNLDVGEMMRYLTRNIEILRTQKRPARFLISRVLRYSGLWRIVKINRSGYSLHLHPASLSMSLWSNANARHSDSDILKSILRPGDVYVDVGANIGHLAIEASLIVGKLGRVFAFEAHPRTAHFLRQNIRLNKLSNIQVAQVAVGSYFGWVSFSDNRSDDQNMVTELGSIVVPLVTLDALLSDESPTLLKIDVEGFEKFVLMGAENLLERTQFIYFEAWDDHFEKNNYDFSEIFIFLQRKGFEIIGFIGASKSVTKITKEDRFLNCVNLLAYRNEALFKDRMSPTVE